MGKAVSDEGAKLIVQNRKARHEYHIIETIEAGLVLTGEEIKSLRAGEATIAESYIRPRGSELYLVNCHIRKYTQSGNLEYDPLRPRKLLLHRRELEKLIRQTETKGYTLVPLDLHLKRGMVKCEIALGKGKAAPDKRSSVKERDSKREIARALKRG
jgi:SsrA-binding protein